MKTPKAMLLSLTLFAAGISPAQAQSQFDWMLGDWVRQEFAYIGGQQVHAQQDSVSVSRNGTVLSIGNVDGEITAGGNIVFSFRPDTHFCPNWRVPLRVNISADHQRMEWDQPVAASGCRAGSNVRWHVVLTR